MAGLFLKVEDINTHNAAEAEGVTIETHSTFHEIELRRQATQYRAKAEGERNEHTYRKWVARAASCNEQLTRFEETRRNGIPPTRYSTKLN